MHFYQRYLLHLLEIFTADLNHPFICKNAIIFQSQVTGKILGFQISPIYVRYFLVLMNLTIVNTV